MTNQAVVFNAGPSQSNSAYYHRPDHSILSDIDPDSNHLNTIKKSINSDYYNKTTFKNKHKKNSNFSALHLNIRSAVSHFTEFLCYLDTLDFEFNPGTPEYRNTYKKNIFCNLYTSKMEKKIKIQKSFV